VQALQKEEMTLSRGAARKLRWILRVRKIPPPVEMIELLILMILVIGLLSGAVGAISSLYPRH
jgi:hypothetical protein